MPPTPAPFPTDAATLAPFGPPADVLHDLIAVSLTGVIFYTPVYDSGGEIVDFNFVYLNAAAQRMMQMPERPTLTHMEQWPQSKAHGTFAFHVDAFESGEPREYNINYQADGYDNYYRLAARRSGQGLLVSFTDTADQPRTAVEVALREAQARERAALAATEKQRAHLERLFMQAPAAICRLDGPELSFGLVNPGYQELFPGRALHGLPLLEALPELQGHAVWDTLQHVYRTGESHVDQNAPIALARVDGGPREENYFNYVFQAAPGDASHPDGVLVYAFNVTEQVRARQQLQQLNQELETRVQVRTQEVEAARAEAEEQRNRLQRLFSQAPALINIFTGPDHVLTLVHPATAQLLQNRPLLGLPRRQALPELPEAQHEPLDRVYQTGEPYHAHERLSRLDRFNDGELHDVYLDLTFQPLYDTTGRIEGVMSFAVDVSERVRARQQAEALQATVLAAAQRQAREREAFHAVFEQTPALIALLRAPGHRFDYVNPAYQRLFAGRELLGRDFADALPEARAQGFVALLDHVHQTGETYFGAEVPFSTEQSGRKSYFNFTYQAYWEDGAIAGVSIFAYDVTEQVLARQQREAGQLQLQRLLMQAPAAISILAGPELVYELVNPVYQGLFPGRALQGRAIADVFPELAGTGVVETFQEVYRTGVGNEEKSILIPFTDPNTGQPQDRYFNYIQQARRDAHGLIDGVLVFAFEITEQVLARQASEASTRQLQLITDALPVLISYIDHEQTYRFANRAYEDWFHISPAEMVGKHPREVAGDAAYEQVRGYVERVLSGELVEYEAFMNYREGFAKHVRSTFIPDVRGGRVAGFFTLVADVTEQVETRQAVEHSAQQALALAAELAAANRQLVHTNVDLDTFIYTASHDLRAPISNIEGLLYTLQGELPAQSPAGEVSYILDLMQDSVERFKKTIDHLTDVSKLQKEHEQPTASVPLAAVIEEVRLDLAPLLQQTGGRLDVDVLAVPTVMFTEKNLRSVVYNLLSNAFKYRHPDRVPEVRVRARREAPYLVLEVQDNGLGLDLTREEQVFAMFQRLHTHVEGSGVGLYMVKRMVENAGGHITVHSRIGEGATFTVYLKS